MDDNQIVATNKNAPLQYQEALNFVVNKAIRYVKTKERALQFTGIFATEAQKNRSWLNCTPESIITSLMSCVYFDLMPNTPQGFAYLIPFGNNLTFQLGYKGLIELARRSGEIKTINAELVFPEDVFDVSYGTNRSITHKPSMNIDRGDSSRFLSTYATATTRDGYTNFEVMNKDEIDRIVSFIEDKNKKGSNVWRDWGDRMIKKTVIKKLLKYMPQSSDDLRLAMALDSAVEGNTKVNFNAETNNFDITEAEKLAMPDKKEVDISGLRSKEPEDTTSDEDLNNIIEVK